MTKAAEDLHIAQPALSKQMRNMERYYGTKLVICGRGTRKFLLTEAGRVLYQKAKYICSLDDSALGDITDIKDGAKGTLRFSITSSRSALFVKRYLKRFIKLNPRIKCELFEASIDEQYQQLLNGTTEIGILSVPQINENEFEVLFRKNEQLAAVYKKNSVWLDKSKKTVCLSDLKNMPLSISNNCAQIIKEACEEQAFTLDIICTSTSRQSTLQWAKEGAAVAILLVEPDEEIGEDYVAKKIEDIGFSFYKTVVKVKNRPLSVAAQNFLKYYAKTRSSEKVCNLDNILKKEIQ